MVLIHIKTGDQAQFLHEAPANSKIEDILKDIVYLNNSKVKVEKLIESIKELLEYGPLRPEGIRGLITPQAFEPAYENLKPNEKEFLKLKLPGQVRIPDPRGLRIGWIPSETNAEQLKKILDQAKTTTSNDNPDLKKLLLKENLQELLMLFKNAVMMCYPEYKGLPEWDPVYLILEDKVSYQSQYPDCEWIDAKTATLWWAKRELTITETLSTFFGRSENTKIVVKLTEKGKSASLANPITDKETHQKMLNYYYKQQEEMKRLDKDTDDDYLNSAWANSQNLKYQLLNGGKEIRFKSGLSYNR